MLMKLIMKTLAVLATSGILLLSGCGAGSSLPKEIKELYTERVEDYISTRYPDLEYSSITILNLTNVRASVICDNGTFNIYNILNEPYDDYQSICWKDEARQRLEGIAVEVFGRDVKIEFITDTYYTSLNSPRAATVEDYLSTNKSLIFGLAIAGSSANKEADLEKFITSLTELGCSASFVVCYYADYSTLNSDFDVIRAMNGYGSFQDWVLCPDMTPLEWHDEGVENTSAIFGSTSSEAEKNE